MQTSTTSTSKPVAIMAAACGITVANVYICQPLLSDIAASLNTSAGGAGWVATAAQVGYACGILLVVPLADRADPRRLIQVLLALTSLSLICAGFSPSASLLALATLVVTMTTVVPQILIPVAVSIAPDRPGRVLGALQTGLIMGILLARLVSGAVAEYSGSWRTSYFVAAALTGMLLFVLPGIVPSRQPATKEASYLALLASLPRLLIQWRDLRISVALGACSFGAFSVFWATLAFHLASPPFGFGPAQAGLFGLWGAAGALLAPVCGRLSDKHGANIVNIVGLLSASLAFAAFWLTGDVSIFALVVGVNLLDFGVQSGQMGNQARIFKLDPTARARLNTVYMVAVFGGGAVGSAAGIWAWSHAGWPGVCAAGFTLLALAAVLFAVQRRDRRRALA